MSFLISATHRRCHVRDTSRFPKRTTQPKRDFSVEGRGRRPDIRKTRALAASLALLLIGCCPLQRWTKTDTALEGTFAAELVVDGVQTAHIVAECQEYNPIVGRCGERMPFPVYLITAAVLHAAIAAVLPPRAREIFQGVTIGVEAHTLYFNAIVPDQ